uniref:MH2 domain-containing protein n=1 Tax=Panagrolaimus sp. ES5 TaxID=591445 RepID=A0AC34FGL6_9BILA
MSDDFIMLSFENGCTSLNNNDYNLKHKKYSFTPAVIFGALHIPSEDSPETDFVILPSEEIPSTIRLSENLHNVINSVSKFIKTDPLPYSWPLEEIPFAKQANHWCNITFFEYSHQVGNVFRGITPSVLIDGSYSKSDPKHMSLGQMLNVERLIVSREIVSQIGNGLELRLSSTTIELISNCPMPVFLQAPIFSLMFDQSVHVSTVYRLPPSTRIILFDFETFNSVMSKSCETLSWNDSNILQKLASVKISFGKGFGKEYRRTTVEQTPCWLHIVLIDPIRIIDQFLMQSPMDDLTIVHSNS